MRKKYIVQLISLAYKINEGGDNIQEEMTRQVFANKKSVNRKEFYPAYANGLRPEVTFVLWAAEYQDEPRLLCNGTIYEIIRTHTQGEREIELVCQSLRLVQTGLSRLRDQVEIWVNDLSQQNSMGEQKAIPKRKYTLSAQITYEGGSTTDAHGVVQTTNVAKVTIIYRADITSDQFLLIQGQRWDIRYIEDPYHRHETLVLTVERVA